MSTPSQGRSVTVTGLSGRVQALKFMQRGSTASSSGTSTPSTPSTPIKHAGTTSGHSTPAQTSSAPLSPTLTASPAAAAPSYAPDEEQWSLSPAKISQLTAKAKAQNRHTATTSAVPSANIEHEPGFETWLLDRERPSSRSTNTRQTFGSFKLAASTDSPTASEAGKKRARDQSDEPSLGIDRLSQSEEEDKVLSKDPDVGRGKKSQKNGFIKPGSLQNTSKSGGKTPSSPASKASQNFQSGKAKDQDRVVYTRKRGGKQGISGSRN